MVNLLLLCGIILVISSFWLRQKKIQVEMNDLKQINKQLTGAKEEVGLLMHELTKVSQEVVESVSDKIKSANETINKLEVEKNAKVVKKNEPKPIQSIPEPVVELNAEPNNKIINLMETRPKDKEKEQKSRQEYINTINEKTISQEETKSEFKENKNISSAKHQAVYSLCELGYSVEQIAKQLSIGKGEVALILQLRQKGEEINGLW